jgi:membrane associated rhomboid family serine protease
MWLTWIFQVADGRDFYYLGIYPRRFDGLPGIITSPFVHGSFNHLISNTFPFLFLLTAIFYFYRNIAWRLVIYSCLATGFLVWALARPSYHIGASGQIYCYASFLFFSGIVRKNVNLLAISLLVIFLYGSMIWGIFPVEPEISFESHLVGLVVGGIMAVYFRHEGPPTTVREEEVEDDDDEENADIPNDWENPT